MKHSDCARVPVQFCPKCGAKHNAAGTLGEPAVPRPGDLTVCIRCAAPLQYDMLLVARSLDPDDILLLDPEERADLARVIAAVKRVRL